MRNQKILAFLVMVILQTSLEVHAYDELIEERLFKENIIDLSMDVDAGFIAIKGHDESFTTIRFVKNSKACKDQINLSETSLHIQNNKEKGGCPCKYEIYLPSAANVNVSLGAHRLAFSDLKSNLTFNLGSGDVDIKNIEGDVVANLGSGNINYKASTPKQVRTFEINAGTANVNCFFPENSSVETLSEYGFMAKVNSSVKQVNDGSHDFVLTGAIGSGSLDMSYDNCKK